MIMGRLGLGASNQVFVRRKFKLVRMNSVVFLFRFVIVFGC